MKLRNVLAALGGVFVMSISGVALSGSHYSRLPSGSSSAPIQMSSIIITGTALDFDDGGLLWLEAHLPGARIGYYQHTVYTRHLPGSLSHGVHPPSPCDGYTEAWNHLVQQGSDTTLLGQMQFHNLIALMAQHQCTLTIGITPPPGTDGAPTIDTVTPN